MMTRCDGYFQEFVNSHAFRDTPSDRALVKELGELLRPVLPGAELHWNGSVERGTSIQGSDIDLWVVRRESDPLVTKAERRKLAERIGEQTKYSVRVLSHAIRIEAASGFHVDLSFNHAEFGSRPVPDKTAFRERRERAATVRAIKLWTRGTGLPPMPGWAAEAIVLALDRQATRLLPLVLFKKVLGWLVSASPQAVEGVLRPAAHPDWRPEWSARLPGRLQALQDRARTLLARDLDGEPFRNADDVDSWLRGAAFRR